MNNLLDRWGAYVMLFFLMVFMGATLWVSTIIPSHNAKRLEEVQRTLDERIEKFEAIENKLNQIEKIQNERTKVIEEFHRQQREKHK